MDKQVHVSVHILVAFFINTFTFMAFLASRKYVTVQVMKELKCAVVCYLQGRVFNPTILLNNVASSIELMMQI